jgi:predicted secreted protein
MSKIHGKNLTVYVDGDKVGDARDCTLNVNQSLVDTQSKDDANWMTKLADMRDWSIDVAFLHDDDNTVDGVTLVDLILNATQVVVEFSTADSSEMGSYWYGNAYATSSSISAPMSDAVNGSITFVGDGALNKGTLTVSS